MNGSLLAAAIVLVIGAGVWMRRVLTVARFGCRQTQRWPLLVLPGIGVAVLWVVLMFWADPEVRKGDELYFPLFLGVGLIWVFLARIFFRWLNLDCERDALAGRNPAAVWACAGAMLAVELAYAGGNIGAGDETVTTFVSAGLATGAVFILWFAVEKAARPSEAITVERDLAAGVRFAGMLVALGLISGRAVAGDWVSLLATVRDFVRDGWFALPVALSASVVERWLQPKSAPSPGVFLTGVLPALAYLAAAGIWLVHLGSWR